MRKLLVLMLMTYVSPFGFLALITPRFALAYSHTRSGMHTRHTQGHRHLQSKTEMQSSHTGSRTNTNCWNAHNRTASPSFSPQTDGARFNRGLEEHFLLQKDSVWCRQAVRQHILVHIERPLLSSPNKYVGRGAGGEGRAWEETEEVSKRLRERE